MGKRERPVRADAELVSAALRHLRDAEHLGSVTAPHASLDQAYHLAGFGPECARKAAIAAAWANKPLGHDLGERVEWVLDFALTLDPTASRYAIEAWQEAYPALARWSPECRYKATNTYDEGDVHELLRDAWNATAEVLAALWADGRLSLEMLR